MKLAILAALGMLASGPVLAQTSPFQPVPAQPGQPQLKFPSKDLSSPPEVGPILNDGPETTGSLGARDPSRPVYPYGEPPGRGGLIGNGGL